MTFSCPHYDYNTEKCRRTKKACAPQKPGCILKKKPIDAENVQKKRSTHEGMTNDEIPKHE